MKYIFFSISIIVAIIASVLVFKGMSDSTVTSPVLQSEAVEGINIKTTDVLMARINIPVGSIIDSSMLNKQPWPENLVMDNFVLGDKGAEDIIGKVARSAIAANEPFLKSKLANPNDPGFLAAGLPAGMRAVTVATDMVAGLAGFIFPGDRVDILFTHEDISNSGHSSGKPDTTEVLGSNIRVLAVNLREGDPTKPAPVAPNSITLEVTDELAQLVRLAEKNGTLAFSLRSIYDDNANSPNPSDLGDLSRSSNMFVVRGPGSAGGKITSTNALSDSQASDAAPAVVHGGGSEDAAAPEAQPALPVNNKINNNK